MTDPTDGKKSTRSPSRRLRGAVAHTLGRAVLAGDYAPGDALPSELVFAKSFGVSRGAYREAVQTLIAKRLVESRPKSGTRILPRHRWNKLDPDMLAWAFARTSERFPPVRFLARNRPLVFRVIGSARKPQNGKA